MAASEVTLTDWLVPILAPVAEQLCEARLIPDGVVFVIHRPRGIALQAVQTLGIPLRGETTVAATPREAAIAVWGRDLVTRRWLARPPGDDEMKIFLFAHEGTALLTLEFSGDRVVMVRKEPDLHAVSPT